MIVAVDTNVILDVVTGDRTFGPESKRLMGQAFDSGQLVICELVYAELVPQFEDQTALDAVLGEMGLQIAPAGLEVAWLAGRKILDYRTAGGGRERILADFFIGAHAVLRADALLTRDRGFYKSYFPELRLLEDVAGSSDSTA